VTNLACNLIEASRHHPERVALRLREIEVPYTGLSKGLTGKILKRDIAIPVEA
jgi:hypothetical protein